MTAAAEDGIKAGEGVKSADRAMAILEIFRAARTPLAARDIADRLAMPRSSTNVLLRSLIQGGYLRYHEPRTDYYPTLKVFQLGSWLAEGCLDDPAIDTLLTGLRDRTGETVCLWARIGLGLTAMQIVDSPQPIRLQISTGVSAPLFGSTVGAAMLAALPDTLVDSLAAQHASRSGQALDVEALHQDIAITRQHGHSLGYDRWLPDAGAVAVAIHPQDDAEPLVVGVGGPSYRVRRNEDAIIAALAAATRQSI
ncbi:IclR family transcriptional regulator [Polymorphobacter sp.]|uniref:IclR family transcriptional regulator n=1 Tax=Polymorphobacter sp. TaxID=1909290 RepID=UPI003F6ED8A5